jgi:hypothetical protein
VRDAQRGPSLSDYWPLISLVVVSALAAFAIAAGSGQVTMTSVMHAYMGVFLVFFALLKISVSHFAPFAAGQARMPM